MAAAAAPHNLQMHKDNPFNSVVYVYHIDSKTNVTYFGFVRKIPTGGRVQSKHGKNTGAAGTDPSLHGKWTSIGGGYKQTHGGANPSNLKRAITEFNDESAFEYFVKRKVVPKTDVDLSELTLTQSNNGFLKCKLASKVQVSKMGNKFNAVFLFEIEDEKLFYTLFPKLGHTNEMLAKKSLGEIDAAQSFSFDDIITLQNKEVATGNNNFFIKYSITTLIDVILPKIYTLNPLFKTKWQGKFKINLVNDTHGRKPDELTHKFPYNTRNKYLKYKLKYLNLKLQLQI
jgi:hypothetical protein